MLLDIVTNVIANILFWIGLGFAVAALVRITHRRFRGFFGLNDNQNLAVCLSNLWSTETSRRPRGYAISLHELRASEAITKLFSSASFRLPDLVRGLVDTIYLGSHRYDFTTTISPASTDNPKDFAELSGNLIVVGAAGRNSIRKTYLDENLVSLRLSDESQATPDQESSPGTGFAEVMTGADVGRHITAEPLNLVVVEKVHDTTRGITVIFCLGRRGDTTWAASEYIARNWRSLQKEFGDQPFALCLGFRELEYGFSYHEPRRLLTIRG